MSEETTLIHPHQKSLQGLTGKDNNSKLVVNDVFLNDPRRGALYTEMPNAEFKNIKVDGECKCYYVNNLVCDKFDFETRIGHQFVTKVSCDELKNKLMNATLCQVQFSD